MFNKLKTYFRKRKTASRVAKFLQQQPLKEQRVFDNAWFGKHQKGLVWLANSIFGKGIFRYRKMGHYLTNPIVNIAPNAVTEFMGVKKGRVVLKAHFFTRNEYARKLYFVLLPLWWAIHAWDMLIANNFAPELNFGFDELTFYPDADLESTSVDGSVNLRFGTDQDWGTIRDAASGSDSQDSEPYTVGGLKTIEVYCGNAQDKWRGIGRGIFLFDSSALSDSATISDGVFSFYVKVISNWVPDSLALVSSNPTSDTSIAVGDFNCLGTTRYASDIALSGFAAGEESSFTMNTAGKNAISKDGITKLGIRISSDLDDAPNWERYSGARLDIYYADNGSNKPKLVVTYSVVVPTVTTQAVSVIEKATATGNGNITDIGSDAVTAWGVCWNTGGTPTTADDKAAGSGDGSVGAFTASMTGLAVGTHYYVRAYATNISGTAYGAEVEFVTKIGGTVTLSGSGVLGAKVFLIRDDNNTLAGQTTTDADGEYDFAMAATGTYHIAVQYDNAGTKYNAKSLPFIVVS